MKKAAGYVATASLIACPFVSSVAAPMPLQSAYPTTSTTNSESVKLAKNHVLVRNTTASTTPAPTAGTVKGPKQQDKKTIGRCWKRLMTMAREMRKAHHTKE